MYNEKWINEVHVNECAVIEAAKEFDKTPNKAWRVLESLLLLKVITLIDLTTLAGDDTPTNVNSLVSEAVRPLQISFLSEVINSIIQKIQTINSIHIKYYCDEEFFHTFNLVNASVCYEDLLEIKSLLKIIGFRNEDIKSTLEQFLSLKKIDSKLIDQMETYEIHVGAICVYPKLVTIVKEALSTKGKCASENIIKGCSIPIASVAAGFPTGQYDINSKVEEIRYALMCGATEIDIVISRSLVISQHWQELFEEISCLRRACGQAKMKTILAVGECGSLENVYKASMVAMMAGSDYIKTSTGKETVNATLPVGLVMCRAVREFYLKTGHKVGFKPAGGIKTADDSLKWLKLIVKELGPDWLSYFRIGASSLLAEVKKRLKDLNS